MTAGVCHDSGVTRGASAEIDVRPARRRVRLDELLLSRGLAATRSRAGALLLGGRVLVGDGDAARIDRKPGDLVDPAVAIEVVAPEPYVSRGGHKLAAALDAFGIDPAGRACLDVGASTGGFTDVLLQRRARRVYALDVGRGQLATVLRADPRVVSMERFNARRLGPGSLPERVTFACIDVSFISLGLVLPPVASTLAPEAADVVALVKPQFEAGLAHLHDGVVHDPAVHLAVLRSVARAARASGLMPEAAIASPILGPAGNREFLLHLRPDHDPVRPGDDALDAAFVAIAGAAP